MCVLCRIWCYHLVIFHVGYIFDEGLSPVCIIYSLAGVALRLVACLIMRLVFLLFTVRPVHVLNTNLLMPSETDFLVFFKVLLCLFYSWHQMKRDLCTLN